MSLLEEAYKEMLIKELRYHNEIEEKKLREMEKSNEYLEMLINNDCNGKDPNELLTAEQISAEFGISKPKVMLAFQNINLAVQTYTKPFVVLRKNWLKFLDERHDELCEK